MSAQRLARRLCPVCKQVHSMPAPLGKRWEAGRSRSGDAGHRRAALPAGKGIVGVFAYRS